MIRMPESDYGMSWQNRPVQPILPDVHQQLQSCLKESKRMQRVSSLVVGIALHVCVRHVAGHLLVVVHVADAGMQFTRSIFVSQHITICHSCMVVCTQP